MSTDPSSTQTSGSDPTQTTSTQAPLTAGSVSSVGGDIYTYTSYVPSGDGRVWTGEETIYNSPGDESMWAEVNRYLIGLQWIPIMNWTNDSGTTQKYTVTYTTGLKITEGTEVTAGFNLGASYEGMSASVNGGMKYFLTTETTSNKTITTEVNVPPRSQISFYQKQYTFKDSMFFVLDAWGQKWRVGSWGAYDPTIKEDQVQILAEEYYTTETPLQSGTGTMDVASIAELTLGYGRRKRENCTERCKNVLNSLGV